MSIVTLPDPNKQEEWINPETQIKYKWNGEAWDIVPGQGGASGGGAETTRDLLTVDDPTNLFPLEEAEKEAAAKAELAEKEAATKAEREAFVSSHRGPLAGSVRMNRVCNGGS